MSKNHKKKWVRPQLVVITRPADGVSILAFCKVYGHFSGPNNAYSNCGIQVSSPTTSCTIQTGMDYSSDPYPNHYCIGSPMCGPSGTTCETCPCKNLSNS